MIFFFEYFHLKSKSLFHFFDSFRDPSSISASEKDEVCIQAMKDQQFTDGYNNTLKLGEIDASTIDCIFYVGGSVNQKQFYSLLFNKKN